MASLSVVVGQTVELNDGRRAIVRFLGTTEFAPGEWIGVELEEATGKNDGSVKGDRYFDCEPNYGMFLRAAGVGKVIGRVKPTVRSASTASTTRESLMASPVKSPTKHLGAASSRTSVSAAATPRRITSTAGVKPRSSLAGRPSSTSSAANATPSAVRNTPRPSTGGQAALARASMRAAPAKPLLSHSQQKTRLSSVTSNASDAPSTRSSQRSPTEDDLASRRPSALTEDALPHDSLDQQHDVQEQAAKDMPPPPPRPIPTTTFAPAPSQAVKSSSPRIASPPAPSPRTTRQAAMPPREVEDMQAKMRILERKRLEDRERLKKMSEVEQERDKYASVMQKLQTKMQLQSQELAELRKQLKDSETSLENIEAMQAEHDAVVEMATLDREMAEETAEVLKTELEALRGKNEEMTLELEILREENHELGREMSPEERTGQGWLQLERSNERLREALIRLRDVTQEQEADLKAQIELLEAEITDFASVKHSHDEAKAKLLATEANVEDLRQQLEAALGAEDMIEELTERNMSLQDRVEELGTAIEDLESLKELNDELEVNHVESEKQLQEEIDFKDSLISEYSKRTAQQQQVIEDYEYTIHRFRELVANLQTDLEEMRSSRQITDKESEDLSNKTRAMLDLNMKLQNSASKTQIKTMDLELRRLDAEEATEHLSIVQLFLSDAFQGERDSVLALLRFKRVGFKARLVHGLIRDRLNNQTVDIADTTFFTACSIMDRLTWISAMAERFSNSISSCSVAEFGKYESALYELEPVERALNSYIEAMRRDDLNENRVDEELQRSTAVMIHLASLHIQKSAATVMDELLMQTLLIQSRLETAALAFSLCKSLVQSHVPGAIAEMSVEETREPALLEIFDTFIARARSAKVIVGKTYRTLHDLRARSLSLDSSKLDDFVSVEQMGEKLTLFARDAGHALQNLFSEEGRQESFSAAEVGMLLSRSSRSIYQQTSPDVSALGVVTDSLRALHDQVSTVNAISSDLENTIEFERLPAPWIARSAEVRAIKSTSADSEAEVARLNEILRDRGLLVRSKEQELEEQGVRIEVLEARMAEAQKRSTQFGDLEANLRSLKDTETTLRTSLAEAQKDVKRLRQERDELRKQAAMHKPSNKDAYASGAGTGSGASRVELDHAKAREKHLQSAIRYLKKQADINGSTAGSDLEWLEQPLFPAASKTQRQFGILEAEAKSACSELLNAVVNSQPVKILKQPATSRLAWRPAQQTIAWMTQKQKEDWETWRDWQDDLLCRARGIKAGAPMKSSSLARAGHAGVVIMGEA